MSRSGVRREERWRRLASALATSAGRRLRLKAGPQNVHQVDHVAARVAQPKAYRRTKFLALRPSSEWPPRSCPRNSSTYEEGSKVFEVCCSMICRASFNSASFTSARLDHDLLDGRTSAWKCSWCIARPLPIARMMTMCSRPRAAHRPIAQRFVSRSALDSSVYGFAPPLSGAR